MTTTTLTAARSRVRARRGRAWLASLALALAIVLGSGSSALGACIIGWCTYYSATPPVNQYQCGNHCSRDNKSHHRISASSTPAHRMEIMEVNNGTIIAGTQVFSTGTNAGVAHATYTDNQYCRINTSMHIKCDQY